MSFLSVKNVYKSYGDNLVLERLNLNIERGEFRGRSEAPARKR